MNQLRSVITYTVDVAMAVVVDVLVGADDDND